MLEKSHESLVSVVVPTLDPECFLAELESFLNRIVNKIQGLLTHLKRSIKAGQEIDIIQPVRKLIEGLF